MSTYDQFVRGVHALLLLTALAAVAGIVWIERDIDLVVRSVPVDYVHQTIYVAGGTITDLEKTLKEERKASGDQLAAAAAGQQKLNHLLDNATAFLAGLGETNRDLATLIENQDLSLRTLETQATTDLTELDASEKQLTTAMTSASRASTSAAELLADPHLAASLAELDAAMAKTNDTMAHLTSIAASGDRDAAMLEARLREALKPASLAKTIFMRALGLAGPAAQVATAARQ